MFNDFFYIAKDVENSMKKLNLTKSSQSFKTITPAKILTKDMTIKHHKSLSVLKNPNTNIKLALSNIGINTNNANSNTINTKNINLNNAILVVSNKSEVNKYKLSSNLQSSNNSNNSKPSYNSSNNLSTNDSKGVRLKKNSSNSLSSSNLIKPPLVNQLSINLTNNGLSLLSNSNTQTHKRNNSSTKSLSNKKF